jgi:hypothetical protein
MPNLSRRDLLKMSGAAAAIAILPSFAIAQRSARPKKWCQAWKISFLLCVCLPLAERNEIFQA